MTDKRYISHEEAKEIASRLIAGAFRREDNRPRFSIPCRPDHDDDCLMIAYIEQQAALSQEGMGWIDVEDRLPGEQGRDSEDVLCFLNGHCGLTDMEARNGGGWGIRLGFYDAEKGYFRCGGRPTGEVTHWILLPTPPASPLSTQGKEKGE